MRKKRENVRQERERKEEKMRRRRGERGVERRAHLLLEEVLSVLERAEFALLLLVLQLLVGGAEVEDQVLQQQHH